MPLQLVPTPASPDLNRFAQDFQDSVRSGEVIGVGVVVMMRGRRFWVDVFGQMTRYPFESIGPVGELEQCLRELGRRRKDTNTTI